LEVRRLAQELLTDMREVVRGYRVTDLGAELLGARSVLSSAGIDCRITGGWVGEDGRYDAIGSADQVGGPAQATLAWVVREGTTNVLRHTQATTCSIALSTAENGTIRLSMENDRAHDEDPLVLGHGLLGLSERVAAAGGVLRA